MNSQKLLLISLIINIIAIGYVGFSKRTGQASSELVISNQQCVEKKVAATDYAAIGYPMPVSKQSVKTSVINNSGTTLDSEHPMKESIDTHEDIQPIEMVMDILGDNYHGVLTEDNLLSVGVSLLNEIIENPSYSESQRLDAFYGLQILANNSETYLRAASTLLGDALYSDDSEHQAELLYQLKGVATQELADMVSQFLLSPDAEVRIAALSALTSDRHNKYAQSLLTQHASINPQDMLDYLEEIQVAVD